MDNPNGARVRSDVKLVGYVNMTVVKRNGEKVTRTYKNNVLNAGRLSLLRALSNASSGSEVYFNSCIVSNQGAELQPGGGYIEKQVPRDRDGLYGPTLDQVAVVCSISFDTNNNPFATVSSVIGYESTANGTMVNEVALVLKNGDKYAMVTWPGTYKDADTQLIIEWLVYFL